MILFLDFDGVLHPDPCFDPRRMFAQVPRLARVLSEFPQVDLVLTTNWRSQKTLAQLREPLAPMLADRVIGTTPHFSDFVAPPYLHAYKRHAECVRWLIANDRTDRAWIALDDRASSFAPDCEQLIECDSSVGLDERTAGRLRFALLRATKQLDAIGER